VAKWDSANWNSAKCRPTWTEIKQGSSAIADKNRAMLLKVPRGLSLNNEAFVEYKLLRPVGPLQLDSVA